jgi:hypothetical protein
MQWITLTNTDLTDARATQILTAAQTNATAAGQSDPLPIAIARVTEELRGVIGFSGKYQVSATANTLPPNLKDMAVQKVIRMVLRRLNQPALLTEDDRQDERTYEARLNLIRAGNYQIDLPDDPLDVAPSTPVGAVGFNQGDCRQYTTKGLQNL